MRITYLLCYLVFVYANLYAGEISYKSPSGTKIFSSNVILELRNSQNQVLLTEETDDQGRYFLTPNPIVDYNVYVIAKNPRAEVGTDSDNRKFPLTVYNQYESYQGNIMGSSMGNISISSNVEAFNLLSNFNLGYKRMATLGLYPKYLVRLLYQKNTLSFVKGDNSIKCSADYAWKNDAILHELGHLYMYDYNCDYSLGGTHYISQQYDLRLAYGEGLAYYISSFIRNDPEFTFEPFFISSIYNFSTNELGVASALWRIGTSYSHSNVFKTILEVGKRTNGDYDQNANMDNFEIVWNELYPQSSINSILIEHSYSNYKDIVSGNSAMSPYVISSVDSNMIRNLTWYPKNNEDFFSCSLEANVTYTFSVNSIRNGGLPSLNLYNSDNLLQTNNLDSSSSAVATSTINFTPTQNINVVLKTSRFNSTSNNYGLGVNDRYSMTSGYYGTYDLSFSSNKLFPPVVIVSPVVPNVPVIVETPVPSTNIIVTETPTNVIPVALSLPPTTITASTTKSDLQSHISQSISSSANTSSERVSSIEKILAASSASKQEITSGNSTTVFQTFFAAGDNLVLGSGSSFVLMSNIPAGSKAMITKISVPSDLGISSSTLGSALYVIAATDILGAPITTPITIKIPKTNTVHNEGTLVKVVGNTLQNQSATVTSDGDFWTTSFIPASGYAVTGATTVPVSMPVSVPDSSAGGGGGGGGCLLK